MSLASQEELTDVINFLSGAPIKLRLVSDDDANPSMAESHMTPIDSGLGSIYSAALSNVTVPSTATAYACEKTDNKESCSEVTPSVNLSETKERAKTPDLHLCTSVESSKEAMVTTETQTSPSTELCPVLFVKSANSDSESQCEDDHPSKGDEGNSVRIPSPVLPQSNTKLDSESTTSDSAENKNDTPQPGSPSQAKQEGVDASITSPDSVPMADTPNLSVANDQQIKQSKIPSPVLVTVSSEECDGDKTLSISESLR